ncbi:MAG TPA: ATP-dependent metallopeptidase FtsH/Yme1/Tma family protein [Proteobacteria bacterium]|nr:ATP-dependent metallopeptidase FtsH/Yme1/Tma family protein [Pseudomonadota bacterium]
MNEQKPKSKLPQLQNPKKLKILIFWLVGGLLIFYLYYGQQLGKTAPERLGYSEVIDYARSGRIFNLAISGEEGTGQFKADDGQNKEFTVVLPLLLPPDFLSALEEDHVPVSFKEKSWLSEILPVLIGPLLFVGLLWFLFYRQMRGAGRGAMSFGKSRAKLHKGTDKITFNDVAGVEESKEELEEIIAFLKDPKKFQRLGGRIPKGIILIGPPGTGKTLLAKAVAGEADVPFFSLSGSDFVEMFVGVGASRVRDMFAQGLKNAPCIIFLDEIDAVGRHRGAGLGGGHDEREQTLNQLLVEMDGFESREGVILIAATNRPDVLDPALLRPGRFDRQIIIDMPDIKGREAILKVHVKKIVLARSVVISRIARGTPGFSGADLANMVNEAALLAAKHNKKSVGMFELEEARDKVRWGRERKSRVMDEEDRKVTAYHEAGHALVISMIPGSEPLHKVTIIPRGIAYLGATMQLPEKDRYLEFRKKLLGVIAGLFGGRIAEEVTFGDITAGSKNDIKVATGIARRMVCEWGMSDKLGPMTYGEHQEHIFLGREINRSVDYSEAVATEIDRETRRIIDDCYRRAEGIIAEHRDILVAIAAALLSYEVLNDLEVKEIIETGGLVKKLPRKKKRKAKEKKTEPPEEKKEEEPVLQPGFFPPQPAENPAAL